MSSAVGESHYADTRGPATVVANGASDVAPVSSFRSPSALTLAAVACGVSLDDAHAYNEGRQVDTTALRLVWDAVSPDFREHNADLRQCRIYLVSSGSWLTLGTLSSLEVDALVAALTVARWEVRFWHPGRGSRSQSFVSHTDAQSFAATKTYRASPAKVEPIARAL